MTQTTLGLVVGAEEGEGVMVVPEAEVMEDWARSVRLTVIGEDSPSFPGVLGEAEVGVEEEEEKEVVEEEEEEVVQSTLAVSQ